MFISSMCVETNFVVWKVKKGGTFLILGLRDRTTYFRKDDPGPVREAREVVVGGRDVEGKVRVTERKTMDFCGSRKEHVL